MTWVKGAVCLGVVTLLWAATRARGDTQVSCVLGHSCVLPCTFQPAQEEVIHWIQMTAEDLTVHSYYTNQNQLKYQDLRFTGRTSLFLDQISRGNASLNLTQIAVQDEGQYKCYTSTTLGNKESFISLKVEAPGQINIRLVENTITCSSIRIYPAPSLTWSTSPPTALPPHDPPTVHKNSQQLYNISSSLEISANDTQLSYICNISNGKVTKTTLSRLPPVSGALKTNISIPCTAANGDLKDFDVVWRFNHTELILTYYTPKSQFWKQLQVQEPWKQQVRNVSWSGSLELQSAEQEGIYTCELTHVGETHVTNTFLKVASAQQTDVPNYVIIGVVSVLVVVIISIITAIVVIVVKKPCRRKQNKTTKTEDGSDGNKASKIPLLHLPTMKTVNVLYECDKMKVKMKEQELETTPTQDAEEE